MTKNEIVTKLAAATNFTKKDLNVVFDAFMEVITDSVKSGEEVRLPGLGKFAVADRAARVCRNPQTGETISVPAKKAVKFVVSKTLKDAIAEA